jgi:L-fucose isomerase
MSEISRRIQENIFDPEEYHRRALWVKANCTEGPDFNDAPHRWERNKLDADWEYVVKMAMIFRDLMPRQPEAGSVGIPEEAEGHNAIAPDSQGHANGPTTCPTADFLETMLNSVP